VKYFTILAEKTQGKRKPFHKYSIRSIVAVKALIILALLLPQWYNNQSNISHSFASGAANGKDDKAFRI